MRRCLSLLVTATLASAAALTGSAVIANADVEVPVLHAEQRRGTAIVTPAAPVQASGKTADGSPADWTGAAPGFAGFSAYSHGELVYTDYLFDAYGAEDGDDGERVDRNDMLAAAFGGAYRLEPTYQYDIAGELGAPSEELGVKGERAYGDAQDRDGRGHVAGADLRELRFAADGGTVSVLASTTTFTDKDAPALLLLVDSVPGSTERTVPFGSGLKTKTGDVAVLVAPEGGVVVDLTDGSRTTFAVAADPTANTLEATIPRKALGLKKVDTAAVSAATGLSNGNGGFVDLKSDKADLVNIANVAFRPAEPVRMRFDKLQAFALATGSIDDFARPVDLAGLEVGRSETFRPGPGYHEKQFRSADAISTEVDGDGENGVWQPYGAYVPSTYSPAKATRLTWWMHWRGGEAHDAASVSPRTMRDFGEDVGGLVVAPRGRGQSSWYVGKAQVDFREVWDDAMATFNVDRNRVYVTGHSMGGWASYLLPILYPDRFAAALPYAGVPTQGLYVGCDFDECFQGTNGGDAKAQWTNPLLPNLRNVPIAISHGVEDELVPIPGVVRQVQKLHDLGYQYRFYAFPNYEHYSHPIHDEWKEGATYANSFVRNPNPAHVTYLRSMPFERTVETGPNQDAKVTGLDFAFDSAYWMSGLEAVDATNGTASVDAVSLAIGETPQLTVPEAGGPTSLGQTGPWVMQGQRWLADPLTAAPAKTNGFTATLSGARAVAFDLNRMKVDSLRTVTGTVTTTAPLTLTLTGAWLTPPTVTVGGQPLPSTLTGGVLTVSLPAGTSALSIA
jgi:predicted esterase